MKTTRIPKIQMLQKNVSKVWKDLFFWQQMIFLGLILSNGEKEKFYKVILKKFKAYSNQLEFLIEEFKKDFLKILSINTIEIDELILFLRNKPEILVNNIISEELEKRSTPEINKARRNLNSLKKVINAKRNKKAQIQKKIEQEKTTNEINWNHSIKKLWAKIKPTQRILFIALLWHNGCKVSLFRSSNFSNLLSKRLDEFMPAYEVADKLSYLTESKKEGILSSDTIESIIFNRKFNIVIKHVLNGSLSKENLKELLIADKFYDSLVLLHKNINIILLKKFITTKDFFLYLRQHTKKWIKYLQQK